MNDVLKKVEKCYESLCAKIDFQPRVALVLGSGLGNFAEYIQVEAELDYKEIENFPVSTVPGHAGKFIFGRVNDVPIVCMKGRVHYYEGYPITDVVLPIRLMYLMGAKTLILTNAAGGIKTGFMPGDLMMITDHISCFVPNPLVGANLDTLGTRFPDMSEIYSKELQAVLEAAAKEEGVSLKSGVYAQLTGPSYESPAEIRMLKCMGADAVGMSTAVEAITANHMGMKVCGISCISNMAAGLNEVPLSHKEVQEAADKSAPNFIRLVQKTIQKIG